MYYLLMTYVYQHSVKLAEKVKNIRMHYFMPHWRLTMTASDKRNHFILQQRIL